MAITRIKTSGVYGSKYIDALGDLPGVMPAPTATVASGTSASVAFTTVSGATSYTVISSPGSITATGASSPITVTGLTTGTAYTFQIAATNAQGQGGYSAASNSVTPDVTTGWFNIATTTLASAATSITVSAIPGTYKDLHVRCVARKDAQGYGYNYIAVNSSTGYFNNEMRGYPYTVSSSKSYNNTYFQLSGGSSNSSNTANGWGTSMIEILDYADSSKIPMLVGLGGAPIGGGAYGQFLGVAQGQATSLGAAAVTSITIFADQGNFIAGTTLAVYGIK